MKRNVEKRRKKRACKIQGFCFDCKMSIEKIPGGRSSPHYHLEGKQQQELAALDIGERAKKYEIQAQRILTAKGNDALLAAVAQYALPIAQSSHQKQLDLVHELLSRLDFSTDGLDTIDGEKEREGITLALATVYRKLRQ